MVAPAPCARPDPLSAAHSRTYLRNRRLCFPGNRNSGPEIRVREAASTAGGAIQRRAHLTQPRRMRAFAALREISGLREMRRGDVEPCTNHTPGLTELKLLFVQRELTVDFPNYPRKPWIFPGFL
jgi:hypothetical protein